MKRIFVAAVLALLFAAPAARASDTIYWSSYLDGGAIRLGTLGATGKQTLFSPEDKPQGIAIDAAAGRLYWADATTDAIRVGNLDGSGARTLFPGEDGAAGVAIDPPAGKLYWTDTFAGTVRTGNLDGTGARTLFAGEAQPNGVAIDPVSGRIYWGLYSGGKVRYGSLAGGTGADLISTAEPYVTGIAIDPAGGKLYWTNEFDGRIRYGSLSGGAGHDLYTGEIGAGGIALDTSSGKIYWGNYGGTVRIANIDGSGVAQSLFTAETDPWFVSILRAPARGGAPVVSGGGLIGQSLTCTGVWAPDLLGGHVYRAPQSFAYQWFKDGATINGANAATYTPFATGGYSCQVTAANRAGSSEPQTSAQFAVAAPPAPPPVVTPPPPVKLKQLNVRFRYFFDYTSSKRNKLTVFTFSELPKGAKIEVRCVGKGCPFSRKAAKFKGSKANLVSLVKRGRLVRGAYFEVRISASGYITEVLRFTAAGFHGGTDKRLCLPAGAKSPRRC